MIGKINLYKFIILFCCVENLLLKIKIFLFIWDWFKWVMWLNNYVLVKIKEDLSNILCF